MVIRFAAMPPTPSAVVSLVRMTPKKDTREAVVAKVRSMGFGGKSTLGETEVELKSIPGDGSVLYFEPKAPLPAGEYAIELKDTAYGYLFGITQ